MLIYLSDIFEGSILETKISIQKWSLFIKI